MRHGRTRSALLAAALVMIGAAPPVGAESIHHGAGAFRLRLSTAGVPSATDPPAPTSWSVVTTSGEIAVVHRAGEATVGSATVQGSLAGSRENTLGGIGTASLTLSATATAFNAVVTGAFIRTQTLFQVELAGTAADANGEIVPVRVTGTGTWRPTSGDGVVSEIREAEVVIELAVVFPGTVPPPPGPKAGGTGDFAGTATLPAFPCPPPMPGELPCQGMFEGNLEGVLAGDAASGIWAVDITAPITLAFSYADLIEPGAPCIEGLASGTATLSIERDGTLGFWTNRVDVPELVKGAELTFSYSWRREGATAVMTLTDVSLRLHTAGPRGWVQVIDPGSATASAAAVFQPHLTEAHLAACGQATPGPALTATVNGAVSIAGL